MAKPVLSTLSVPALYIAPATALSVEVSEHIAGMVHRMGLQRFVPTEVRDAEGGNQRCCVKVQDSHQHPLQHLV